MTCPDCERMREALNAFLREHGYYVRSRTGYWAERCECDLCQRARAALAPEPACPEHDQTAYFGCPSCAARLKKSTGLSTGLLPATPEPEGAKHHPECAHVLKHWRACDCGAPSVNGEREGA